MPDASDISRLWRGSAFGRWLSRTETLVIAALALGVLLRVAIFMQGRMLWHDEAMVALNLITRDPSELLQPLNFQQLAPIGWLLVEDWLIKATGSVEYGGRLLSLAASLGSLWLFYRLVTPRFSPAIAAIAVALFAVNATLLRYTVELKSYGLDVLIFLALVTIALPLLEKGRISLSRAVLFGAVGTLGAAFSLAAPILLGGIGGVVIVRRIVLKDFCGVTAISLGCAVAAGVFLYFLTSFYEAQAAGTGFRDSTSTAFFQTLYAPLLPTSLADLAWYVSWGLATVDFLADYRSSLAWLTIAVCGAVACCRQSPWSLALVGSPVVTSIFVSGLEAYPVLPRLVLYYIPVLVFLIATALEALRARVDAPGRPFVYLVALTLLAMGGWWVIRDQALFAPRQAETDISAELHVIRSDRRADELVFVSWGATPAYLLYREKYGLASAPWAIVLESEACARDALQAAPLRAQGVWSLHKTIEPPRNAQAYVAPDASTVSVPIVLPLGGRLEHVDIRPPVEAGSAAGSEQCLYEYEIDRELLGGVAPYWGLARTGKVSD